MDAAFASRARSSDSGGCVVFRAGQRGGPRVGATGLATPASPGCNLKRSARLRMHHRDADGPNRTLARIVGGQQGTHGVVIRTSITDRPCAGKCERVAADAAGQVNARSETPACCETSGRDNRAAFCPGRLLQCFAR